VDGFIIGSTEECKEKVNEILENPDLALRLGRAARETVREKFLSTRHVANYLKLLPKVSKTSDKIDIIWVLCAPGWKDPSGAFFMLKGICFTCFTSCLT